MKYLFLFFSLGFFPAVFSAQSIFDSLYQAKTSTVYFATGQHHLDAEAERVLDSVLFGYNASNGAQTLRITAHTDSVGSASFNEKLAKRRGVEVAQAFKKRGVAESALISVVSFGERKPVVQNNSEEGRGLNRRASIEVAKKIPMSVFEGRVTDSKTGEGLESIVSFRSKTRRDSVKTDTTGHYSVRLPKDSVVRMEVQARDHFFESNVFKVYGSPELYKKYKISPDIQLPPADSGASIAVRNIFFVGDEAILLEMSKPELPNILRFLQLNPELVIEIGGHINLPYPKQHNYKLAPGQTPAEFIFSKEEPWRQKLSQKRAETVYAWLVQHGIPKERMSFKGYNNSKMLFPHATDAKEQEQNRRVEITIIGKR